MQISDPPTAASQTETHATIDILVEALLASRSNKEAGQFLRALAAILTDEKPENVVGIRETVAHSAAARRARSWLRGRLAVWLARHG